MLQSRLVRLFLSKFHPEKRWHLVTTSWTWQGGTKLDNMHSAHAPFPFLFEL